MTVQQGQTEEKSWHIAMDSSVTAKWSFGLKVTIISTFVSIIGLFIGGVKSWIATHERIAKSEATLISIEKQVNLLLQLHLENKQKIAMAEQKVDETQQQVATNARVIKETHKAVGDTREALAIVLRPTLPSPVSSNEISNGPSSLAASSDKSDVKKKNLDQPSQPPKPLQPTSKKED